MHPSGYEPMLATASKQLEGDGWAFEPKLDGWRAVVHVSDGQVAVYSRPGRNVTQSVPQLAALIDAAPSGTVLDGELVAGSGRASSFYRLSPQFSGKRSAVSFAAFDLLAIGGRSLLYAPYAEWSGCFLTSAFSARRGAPCRPGPTSRCQTCWPPASFRG